MKKLYSLILSVIIAPSLVFAVPQDAAIDKDKTRNDTHAPVNWKTTRTGEYDVPHVIATKTDGTDISAGGGGGAATIADGADVTQGAKADAKSTATDTTAVTQMSVLKQISASVQAPPSQAVTNAGTFAVQSAATIADGSDATLGAKADAKSTATDTTAISAISILKEISAMEQAPASRAVTNAGTFAVQSNTSAINGVTPLMGNGASGTGAQRVTIANDSTGIVGLTTGSAQIGHLEANQSSNVAQINGVTPLMGAGNTGTGSPRVTIASDQGVISVKRLVTSSVNGQVTAGGAGTLVAANAARSKCTVRNQDSSLSVYVGEATVSSANGLLLKAGESRVFETPELIQVIAPSGSPVVDYIDESY